MNIGNTLKSLRTEKKLTQFQLAQALNIGQATIAGYENNTREPRLNCLIEYANFFECSLDYLVGREDDFGNILIPPTKQKKETAELTPDGKELIEIFNSLEKEYRVQILEYARYFAQRRGIKTKKFEF